MSNWSKVSSLRCAFFSLQKVKKNYQKPWSKFMIADDQIDQIWPDMTKFITKKRVLHYDVLYCDVLLNHSLISEVKQFLPVQANGWIIRGLYVCMWCVCGLYVCMFVVCKHTRKGGGRSKVVTTQVKSFLFRRMYGSTGASMPPSQFS